jgi:hypothetical protein
MPSAACLGAAAPYEDQLSDYNRRGDQYRGYPINNIFGNSSSHVYNTECHAKVAPEDQPGVDWRDKQLWNNVSPW